MRRGLIVGIVVVVIIFIIGLGIFIYSSNRCAGAGELCDYSGMPDKCCSGLKDVSSPDSISISDKCYWKGTSSGSPIGECSDCGNGICEDVESVCGCAEDCAGKGKSDYATIQQFCEEGYDVYCDELTEEMGLDICKLC